MNIRTEPAFVRRRRVAVACAVALAVLSTAFACDRARDNSPPVAGGVTSPTKTPTASATATPTPTASPTSTQSPTPEPADDQPVSLPPADTTDFTRLDRLTGRMSPKSVVAGPGGIITA
ncbi:MAG: hypothetical protein ABI047_05745, partial [Jatrophihabitantaceae bacterium]